MTDDEIQKVLNKINNEVFLTTSVNDLIVKAEKLTFAQGKLAMLEEVVGLMGAIPSGDDHQLTGAFCELEKRLKSQLKGEAKK